MQSRRWEVFLAVVMVLMVAVPINGQEAAPKEGNRLGTLKSQFEELKADAFSAQKKFEDRYLGELKKLEEKALEEANLELVLAVREEAKGFRTREAVTEKPSHHGELARLQNIYDSENARIGQERDEKIATLVMGYRKQLADLRIELTKAGDVDAAVEVQREEQALEPDPGEGADQKLEVRTDQQPRGFDLKAIMEAHRWRRHDKKGASADLSFQEGGTLTVLRGGSTWTRWRTLGDRLFLTATGQKEFEFKLKSPRPPYVLDSVSKGASHLRFTTIE